MSLDRQKLLSELGSVMNQLQSADCGCMGKLFNEGNQGGGGHHHGHRGCCHGHGCGHFAGGDPSMNPCMGRCNPTKLYADTYGYLNQNLMKPIVNEVYQDLRSLTPDNTVMNNPLGAQMGLMQGGGMQGKQQMHGGSPMDNEGMGQMQGRPQMYGGSPMNSGRMGQMQGTPHMYGGSPMENGGMGQMQGTPQMYGGSPMDNGGIGQMQGRPQMYEGTPMDNGEMGQMQGTPHMYGGSPMDNGGMGQMQGTPQMHGGSPMDSGGMGQMQSGQMGNQHMNQMMAGMGPQIVQMMNSGSRKSPKTKFGGQGGVAPTGEMMQPGPQDGMQNDMSMQGTPMQNAMPSSGMGMQNAMPTTGMPMQNEMPTTGMPMQNAMPGINQRERNPTMVAPAMHNPGFQQPQNPTAQPNMGATSHNEQMASHFNLRQENVNPRASYTTTNNTYGAHTQGMRKFNEMFPGIMNGELGFDPMAIAMQMNPANHRKVAMETMNKMMMGNGRVNPALAGVQATSAALAKQGENQAAQGALTPQGANLQNMPPSQQIAGQQGIPPTQTMQNPQGNNAGSGNTQEQMPQQQVYTALTGAPNMEQPPQQLSQQEYQAYQQQQQQQRTDPNTGAVMQENAAEQDNHQIQHQQELLYKEPIYPVDTSKNNRFAHPVQQQHQHQQQQMREPQQQRNIEYNMFGQPVELVNADLYKPPPIDPNEPMTLYPSAVNPKLRNDIGRFGVKNTVSKTSLMGNRPVGRTPSRSQMQQIYNQYKGSHSYTQQNIPIQNNTHSDRQLQQQQKQQQRQVPVERVGGDTAANNQVNNAMPVKGEPVAQMGGDVPQQYNKPQGDNMPLKEPPRKQTNLRNGLQDMQFSNYQHNSQAWSFHGDRYYQPAFRRGRVH